MSLFETQIRNEVTASLKDELKDVTLTKVDSTYSVSDGKTTETEEEFSGRGFAQSVGRSDGTKGLVESLEVGVGDREVVILQKTLTDDNGNEIEPEINDKVEIDGTEYLIRAVKDDPANVNWVVVGKR